MLFLLCINIKIFTILILFLLYHTCYNCQKNCCRKYQILYIFFLQKIYMRFNILYQFKLQFQCYYKFDILHLKFMWKKMFFCVIITGVT